MFRIRAVIFFGACRDADAVWEPATTPSGPTRLSTASLRTVKKLHTFGAPNWAWEKRWWPNDEKTIYWIHLSFFSWPHRDLSLQFFYQSDCDTSANLLYCVKGGENIYISIQKSFDCCSVVRREIIEMKLEIYEGNREKLMNSKGLQWNWQFFLFKKQHKRSSCVRFFVALRNTSIWFWWFFAAFQFFICPLLSAYHLRTALWSRWAHTTVKIHVFN